MLPNENNAERNARKQCQLNAKMTFRIPRPCKHMQHTGCNKCNKMQTLCNIMQTLGRELTSRASAVSVSWVKGHATETDVVRGRVTREDKIGNDGADTLAVAGAALHTISSEVVAVACQRRRHAIQTHRMMLAILAERNSHEQEAADRGSEMGDHNDLHLDVSDNVEDVSDSEGLHAAGMNSLDDDFEKELTVQSDA